MASAITTTSTTRPSSPRFNRSSPQATYPSKAELSDRLGIGERQVQRYIRELEENGLLKRVAYYGDSGGRENNRYDLSGLVKRLAEIAPDFIAEREERKRKRKAAAMPGGGRRRTPRVQPSANT